MPEFIFEERHYQREAVAKVLEHFSNGKESVLLEAPVGSGKTIMGLLIVKALQAESNKRLQVNWVASRRHILDQTQRLNDEYFGCDINMVSVFNSNPPKADFIVLDEAHHEATQSCLNMYDKTGHSRALGLSATPQRTDRMRLSFRCNVRCCEIQKLIDMGVLSQYHSYKVPEWSVGIAAKIFCENPSHWGKSLAFFNTISECQAFSEILAQNGVHCEVISGKSNKDAQLNAFIYDDVQVVANVSVLSEGFDLPELRSVFLRDASRLPTIQMAGRGLRKSANKQQCNLIQSAKSQFQLEKIATPAESFRYIKEQWLSRSGHTQKIIETIEQSIELLKERKITLPFYLRGKARVKHIKYVSLTQWQR